MNLQVVLNSRFAVALGISIPLSVCLAYIANKNPRLANEAINSCLNTLKELFK